MCYSHLTVTVNITVDVILLSPVRMVPMVETLIQVVLAMPGWS